MQDRFRFRAWNTQTKIMKEVSQISFDDKQIAEYAPNDKVSIHLNFQPHFILMQCTGLRDKNGKLIFEGDIVKDDHAALHQVKWCYNCFALYPLFKNGYTIGIVNDEIEIIGNIYEHPELLPEEVQA